MPAWKSKLMLVSWRGVHCLKPVGKSDTNLTKTDSHLEANTDTRSDNSLLELCSFMHLITHSIINEKQTTWYISCGYLEQHKSEIRREGKLLQTLSYIMRYIMFALTIINNLLYSKFCFKIGLHEVWLTQHPEQGYVRWEEMEWRFWGIQRRRCHHSSWLHSFSY